VFEIARDRIAAGDVGYRQGRRVAYSIGIAFPPGWDEGHIISMNDGERRTLEPGMTFHLITTMRIAGIGAVGCSDTVLVTERSCETLTKNIPQRVEIRS
jgi:Xaa-Pro dipeptidase